MKWVNIRSHFAASFAAYQRETGATQQSVGIAGGVAQNAVSKLLANDRKGPSVETFVGAIEGLGMSVSAFFAELEAPAPPVVDDEYARVVERLAGLEGLVHSLIAVWSSAGSGSSSSLVNAADVVGGVGVVEGGTAHADPTIHDGARELKLQRGQLAALLGAAQAAQRARSEGVAGGSGSDGVSRRRGGTHAAGRSGRRRKFKKAA
jgi:transcriptional regulator with XRE-family HTH domain